MFYHPRIGTSLTGQEQGLLGEHAPRFSEVHPGEMVALLQSSSWVWAYYLNRDPRPHSGTVYVVTKEDRGGEKVCSERPVSIGLLRQYQSNREIEIVQDKLTTFNYDTLLERYKC